MSGVLDGIRVIDTTRWAPGRWATSLLADYGADVISIIEPGMSERLNRPRPPMTGRNRRSILLNLKAPGALDVFHRLVRSANAMLESYRPGVASRLGVDYDAVRAINPGIVYCSLSSFGQDGPYRDLAAHAVNVDGIAGAVPLDHEGKPMMPQSLYSDQHASFNSAAGLLMGLLHQARTGEGQYFEVAFTDSGLAFPPAGRGPQGDLQGQYPGYNIYECADGEYVALGILEPWFWERICLLFGRDDLAPEIHPKGEALDEATRFFRTTFLTKTRAEWFETLREADLPIGPVYRTTAELAADPHHRARGMVIEGTDQDGKPRFERAAPIRFGGGVAPVRWGESAEGAHTREVLLECGYSQDELVAMAEQGITRLDS